MAREVEAYDLELFAINSGELYEKHKRLARMAAGDQSTRWVEHVYNTVRPLYCRQVEQVEMTSETAAKVAVGLSNYYSKHIKELEQ